MKRAIIVGSAGQDGRILTDLLRRQGCAVVGITRDAVTGEMPLPTSRVSITSADDVNRIIQSVVPDEVYYLAAYHHAAENAPPSNAEVFEKSFAVHVTGLLHVLEAVASHAKQARVFYAASSHVFGEPAQSPQDESTPLNPICPYGITKAAGIHCCRHYRRTHGLFTACGILYNHESEFRREQYVTQKIIHAATAIGSGRQDRLVLGDLDAQIDWGYAPDYVDAMVRILGHNSPDDYVIATGQPHSVREFVQTAFNLLGLDWQQYVRVEPGLIKKQSRKLVGNPAKLHAATGWKPRTSFERMIKHMIAAQERCHQ